MDALMFQVAETNTGGPLSFPSPISWRPFSDDAEPPLQAFNR